MKNRAVILDRDGTINIEKNYLYKIDEFEFTYRADEAIKILNNSGFKTIVITNQSGIARGFFNEIDVEKLHSYINKKLSEIGTKIDKFYYCPHHPNYGIDKYRKKCNCRKPNVELYQKAIDEFNIDVDRSYVIGDKISDLIPGNRLGFKCILVMTGYGAKESYKVEFSYKRKKNLWNAVNSIINH